MGEESEPTLPPSLNPRLGPAPKKRQRPSHTPKPPRTRSQAITRVVSWCVTVLAAVMLVVSGGAFAYVKYQDANLKQLHNVFPPGGGSHSGDPVRPPKAPDKSVNFLIVGRDSRAGLSEAELKEVGTDDNASDLADSIILVHVPKDNSQITMISFPRDLYVTIPQWTSPSGKVYPSHQNKINSALSLGGLPDGNPGLVVSTVEQLTNMRIDNYIEVNFKAVLDIVGALGGLDINVCTPVNDKWTGLVLDAGAQHINASQAIRASRMRHNLPGGDLDRAKNQQYILSTMFKSVISGGVLSNPIKLNSIITTATKSLSVASDDGEMSLNDIKNFALRLKGLGTDKIRSASIPVARFATIGGQAVDIIDEPAMNALLDEVRNEPGSEPATPSSPNSSGSSSPGASAGSGSTFDGKALLLRPNQVTVTVLNASGIAGQGAKAASDLRSAGFTVSSIGTATSSGLTQSAIRYGSNRADSARTLAAALSATPSVVAASDSASSLVLMVGSDWAGASDPWTEASGSSIGGSPAGGISPSASGSSGGYGFSSFVVGAPSSPSGPATPSPTSPFTVGGGHCLIGNTGSGQSANG